MKSHLDTIVAPATPPGRGGVAIVRISGTLVKDIARSLLKKIPTARFATFTNFLDANDNAIDQGIALFFPGPNSFTGEDVLELHGHGGLAIVDHLVRRVLELGARVARPGEFSERAFLNNKLDLAQAEAIADLIDAVSEQAARSALRSLQGEFSDKVHALVKRLIYIRTYLEAAIDFVDEEIDFLTDATVKTELTTVIQELENVLKTATQGSLLREGITAVIAGEPNVGKSSLLNLLSGKDVAIVTNIPGTTRDLLREYIVIDGMPIHIIDTAGLRESHDQVEQEGIRRAQAEIAKADIILFVVDASKAYDASNLNIDHTQLITIRNKIDLTHETPKVSKDVNGPVISISVKDNQGIDLLKNHIKQSAGYQENTEGLFSARRRHLDALTKANQILKNAEQQWQTHHASELLAEDLRQAQHALNEITGEFTSDDLLGKIFSSFCIGK